jgi:hypothetical protein
MADNNEDDRKPTQEELDRMSKARVAGRPMSSAAARPGAVADTQPAPQNPKSTRSRAAAPRGESAALASREAAERNVQDRDRLAKQRAAARSRPARPAGVVPGRADPIYAPAADSPEITAPPATTSSTSSVRPRSVASAASVSPPAGAAAASLNGYDDYSYSDVETSRVAVATANVASVPAVASLNAAAEGDGVGAMPLDGEIFDANKAMDESNKDAFAYEDAPEAAVSAAVEEMITEETPVVYPGADPAMAEGVVADGIEAFVADTVVDATGVAVVMSEEEEEKFEQKRRKKYLCYGAVVLVIVAVSIVVPVVLLVGGDGGTIEVEAPPSIAPSSAPSSMPSSAPTTNTFSDLLDILLGLPTSTEDMFADRSGPQYRAALWLADEDTYWIDSSLALDHPKMIQRFALATFYYASTGNNWKLCGRGSPSCGDTEWLTSVDECEWFSVQCNSDGNVEQMNFRKYSRRCSSAYSSFLALLT